MDSNEQEFFEKQGIYYVDTIAKGGYGIIYYVYSKNYDDYYALKKIQQKHFNPNEINCLISINNPLTINLYQCFRFQGYVYMLMEFCQEDLNQFIIDQVEISPELLQKYIHGMLLAIKACHDRNIAHLDIKPSNFLLDKHGRVKVYDFGLSCQFNQDENTSEHKGTLYFMAPEVLERKEYNPKKADIWSLGVTFYYMYARCYPYMGKDRTTMLNAINENQLAKYKIHDRNLRNMVVKCLNLNPNNRPSIDELLQMEYFDTLSAGIKLQKNNRVNVRSHNAIIIKPEAKMFSDSMFKNCNNLIFKRRMSK